MEKPYKGMEGKHTVHTRGEQPVTEERYPREPINSAGKVAVPEGPGEEAEYQ